MADVIASDLSSQDKDCWATPQWLFDALNLEFAFGLDAAATEQNAKVECFMTERADSLQQEWKQYVMFGHSAVWINPPYSRGMISKFINKSRIQSKKHGLVVVLLVPATPDASWWPTDASEIRFITGGRISFVNPVTGKAENGNTKGSAIIVFNPYQVGCVTRYIQRDQLRAMVIARAEQDREVTSAA